MLSIIILNFNKKELTLSCIESLYKQFTEESQKSAIEIIVVDNASADKSVEFLRKEIEKRKYKEVEVVANDENSGFAKGCNIGAKKAKGDIFLFLNNDTIVKDDGISRMENYMNENDEAAILGGQLRNIDESLQVSTGSFYNLWNVLLLLIGMQRFGVIDKSPDKISLVDWVKGGLMMIRKRVFEELGGFDERIFMYTEDMELCYRAAKKGYKTFFYPDIEVIHKEHGSTNRTFAIIYIYKNLLYFYKKHKSKYEYNIVRLMLKTKAIVLILAGKITGSNYLVTTYSEALKGI